LSDRDLAFDELRPTPPEFQLAGDAERVAITCAALGADARELDLPVPLDRRAYGEALELLTARGVIEKGRLTRYGGGVGDEGIDEWAEGRGVLVKAIEDVALGTASVYRQLELPLPERLAHAGHQTLAAFADLVARIMPFDLVIDEGTADGREARVSRGSVCGSWGAVAGTLRYFADRFGTPRAAIEGTQLPERLVRRYARRGAASVAFDRRRRHEGLVRGRTVEYFGCLLERETEPLPEPVPSE